MKKIIFYVYISIISNFYLAIDNYEKFVEQSNVLNEGKYFDIDYSYNRTRNGSVGDGTREFSVAFSEAVNETYAFQNIEKVIKILSIKNQEHRINFADILINEFHNVLQLEYDNEKEDRVLALVHEIFKGHKCLNIKFSIDTKVFSINDDVLIYIHDKSLIIISMLYKKSICYYSKDLQKFFYFVSEDILNEQVDISELLENIDTDFDKEFKKPNEVKKSFYDLCSFIK